MRQFVEKRFGLQLGSRSCLNYLHRLGFVLKRPKKRLLKANAEQRQAFVATYAELRATAEAQGAKILFVDEAHFRADVELRAKWGCGASPRWLIRPAPSWAKRPLTTRRSAWKRARSRSCP